jgi:hypothetical protein
MRSAAIQIALSFQGVQELVNMLTSIPLRGAAETSVTPLIEFSDRRAHVLTLLRHVTPGAA